MILTLWFIYEHGCISNSFRWFIEMCSTDFYSLSFYCDAKQYHIANATSQLLMWNWNFWCEIGTSDATSELLQIFLNIFEKKNLAWRQNISGDSETRLLFTEQKEPEKLLSYSQFVKHSFNLKLFKHFIKRFSWKRKKSIKYVQFWWMNPISIGLPSTFFR